MAVYVMYISVLFRASDASIKALCPWGMYTSAASEQPKRAKRMILMLGIDSVVKSMITRTTPNSDMMLWRILYRAETSDVIIAAS